MTERPPASRFISLALLAIVAPLACWVVVAAAGHSFLYNDFHDYWFAGRLLAAGHSPYDLGALRALAMSEGDVFLLGTGFSYPLPFAFAMIPFGALPFDVAVTCFNALSLAAFGAAVAAWLVQLHPAAEPKRLRAVALLAGALPPVIGSVLVGQVNLLIVGLLALGVFTILRPTKRALSGGVAIGLAAVVKLVPAVVLAPLWLAGRRSAVAGVVLGAGAPIAAAAILRPDAILSGDPRYGLFSADAFFTNQSINGFVSRLVISTDRMGALAPGAFDALPVVVALTAALAAATLAILWRSRGRLGDPEQLAIAVAFVLVGATAGAPKTSFWNEALALPAAGLLLAVAAPRLTLGELGPADRFLFVAFVACLCLQPADWLVTPTPAGPAGPVTVALASLGLYGSLALWLLLGRTLVRRDLAVPLD